GPAARHPRGVTGYRPQSMLDARGRKTHRARKFRIEQQEFRDTFRPQVRRVDAAIRFERRTGPEKASPFDRCPPRSGFVEGVLAKMKINQRRRGGRPLEKSSNLQKLPAFTMAHGRVGDPL